MPSRIATRPLPCDSPAVRNRSIRATFYPKFLHTPGRRSAIPERSARVTFLHRVPGHQSQSTQSTQSQAFSANSAVSAFKRRVNRVETLQIVADRFGVARDGRAIDLVTGASVLLRIGAGGGAAEQARWSIRCHWLHRLHHRRLASLVDYGGARRVAAIRSVAMRIGMARCARRSRAYDRWGRVVFPFVRSDDRRAIGGRRVRVRGTAVVVPPPRVRLSVRIPASLLPFAHPAGAPDRSRTAASARSIAALTRRSPTSLRRSEAPVPTSFRCGGRRAPAGGQPRFMLPGWRG